jgi:predicted CXXCH cytochrome family protein
MVRALPAAVAGLLLGSACVDETITVRNPFNDPVDQVNGFLGYYSVEDQQTTCGNCHADKQADWRDTKHAMAWGGLHTSEFANDTTCGVCHSVSENGNWVEGPAGYAATFDSTYLDVQCEACHGPGIAHVLEPDATQPLASIAVDTGATNGCGECHQDNHQPFVEQWKQSAHGNTSRSARGREPCAQCHEGVRALEVNFGVTSRFLEEDSGELFPLVCVVCHDPHGGTNNEHQLRAPLELESKHQLCITCHNRNTVPSEGSRGPHAAQGPLVLGSDIGWYPPGLTFPNGVTHFHGDTEANPGLCATCHVSAFEVTDPSTGGHLFSATGHTFRPIPCVDDDGIPAPEPCATSERTFEACKQCHGTETNARNKYLKLWGHLDSLLTVLWDDLNDNDTLEAAPTDAGLLPQIVAVYGDIELDRTDTLFTFAEGILYNAQIAATDSTERFLGGRVKVGTRANSLGGHPTSGNGIHNPWLLDALLKASIAAGADFYGIVLPAGLDLKFVGVEPPPTWRFNR